MYAATQLSSVDLRCNVNATHTPDVLDVYAGEEVTWHVPYTISHPGPLMGYLARAPGGGLWGWGGGRGEGDVWFKIYEDFPTWYTETYQNGYIAHSVRWPNLDLSTLPIPLPPTLPPGEYLFRIEHIGLQTATDPTLGAQFFVSCAQIRVLPPINPQTTIQNHGVGGIPGPLVSIPGLYLPTDEDLKVNVYGVNETTYLNEPYMTRTPGPAIWKG
ncbi:hypothetical protein GLAREA_10619 [Glarea lozoyensis ATCC 20868]|uniref:lytic cellulose monooxygenase (C4-dehydrogenating) n=1 Tax=Glarea lozoyensis (strain ATCC 20868 / MF5171) TaxID=1116229 RepID=S3DCV9_GLAL2|nr:uncharacterized protein GLAREA_10619 [Glarea lozoyensis ATCC 20868]EPE34924.1 hypothetical protein GLAREA_10619 [Glarea lozoyensis ATCC 20868]